MGSDRTRKNFNSTWFMCRANEYTKILATSSLSAYEIDEWDTLFGDESVSYVDQNQFVNRTRNASELCLKFCFECEALNEIYFRFMLMSIALLEVIQGDTRKPGCLSHLSD